MLQLPEVDRNYLDENGYQWEVFEDQGMICVIIHAYQMPSGLNADSVDVMLRLQPSYPDTQPDMWWLHPAVTTASGGVIRATESIEIYLGRAWQRWSRHLNPGCWQPGIDGLEGYFALLRSELVQAAGGVAA